MLARFTGRFLDVSKCEVDWSHDDQQVVGGTTVVKIKVHIYCTGAYMTHVTKHKCMVQFYLCSIKLIHMLPE